MSRTGWVEGHSGHGVHVWFSDIFDHDRDVIIPNTNCFIVRSGDKPPVLVDECDCIDRTQMLIVLLCDFSRIHVVLLSTSTNATPHVSERTHLNNLFIRHTSEENMLLILVWVEFDTIWNLAVTKSFQALARFGIP
jgi:hypothetical protein